MNANEAINSEGIQQAVIEKLTLMSLEQQQQVLAFIEELARNGTPRSKFRAMFEEAARDVPPEAWDEIPPEASSNIDRHLYKDLER